MPAAFPEAMTELKRAEKVRSPDADLIAYCERYAILSEKIINFEENYDAYSEEEREKNRPDGMEAIALLQAIRSLRPVTPQGRRAKCNVALRSLNRGGRIQNTLAHSALLDYLNNDATSRPFMSGQLPENDLLAWDQDERSMLRMYRLMTCHERNEIQQTVKRIFESTGRR